MWIARIEKEEEEMKERKQNKNKSQPYRLINKRNEMKTSLSKLKLRKFTEIQTSGSGDIILKNGNDGGDSSNNKIKIITHLAI